MLLSQSDILIILQIRTQTHHIIYMVLANWSQFFFSMTVDVSFSALACALDLLLQGLVCCLSPYPRESLSFIAELFIFWPLHTLYPSVLLLALWVELCPQRQGGWDERFIWAHRVREEVERELIRISLSKAITLLLTFHLTFSWTNLPSTGGDRQGETEKVLDLG